MLLCCKVNGPKLKALTLLELVVSMGITVMLIAVSIPLFNQERGSGAVQKEAELVAAYMESARSLAQHPESEQAIGYRVKSDSGGRVLSIVRLERISGVESEVVALKNTLTLGKSNAKIARQIDFFTYAGEFKGAEADVAVILNSDSTKVKVVSVTPPGIINVKNVK